MTMLTRCAACGSTFRITPEQLALRQGTVRCGHCGEVFSAIPALTPADGGMAPAAPDTGAAAPLPPAQPAVSTLDTTLALTATGMVLGTPESTERAELTRAGADEEIRPEVVTPTPATRAPLSGSSAAARPSRRHWGSLAGAVTAIIVLGVQAAYFYRNEAVLHFPQSKPLLQSMCVYLSCGFDAPRDAQAISIESHDLQADPANKNLLALIALLRNRANFVQDAPHLELTLTDAQDAPVARRVLSPRDYFSPMPMEAGAELQVRLSIDAGQVRASGYRLYAFYP